jgi:hypothetical protein
MTGLDFSIWLALIACVIGGARIGLVLARETPASEPGETSAAAALDERRLIAVAILAAHIGSAAVLGYGAVLGHGMMLTLGLGWIAASGYRFWNARRLGQRPHGAVVELLTGLVLALPAWADMARLARGSII